MNELPLRTVLVGFGQVAAGYSTDKLMRQYYPYATHAQVLVDHPGFDWIGVVDSSPKALRVAKNDWNVPYVFSTIEEMAEEIQPEVAVIATPPQERMSIIEKIPTLRAVLIEKPFALNLQEAIAISEYCKSKSILVQVNFWRRADEFFRQLKDQLLYELVGELQTIFGIYGNGLRNNGSHMIDFVQMLCGDILAVQAMPNSNEAHDLQQDCNLSFNLFMKGKIATMQAISFENYREIGLDIWGKQGRFSIMQEGLKIMYYPRKPSRSTANAYEIASDCPKEFKSTVGHAFHRMYTNLNEAVHQQNQLWSSDQNAMRTIQVLDAIKKSFHCQGQVIKVL